MNIEQAERALSRALQKPANVSGVCLLHAGRWANAQVYKVSTGQGSYIIKDFSQCPWWVRKTLARSFVKREVRALTLLSSLSLFDVSCYALNPVAFAYPFVKGETLKSLRHDERKLPPAFFTRMERMIAQMHRAGLSHLDLRNFGNVVCTEQGMPHFIDYQSAVSLRKFPRWLQRFMRGADLTGAYKAWQQLGAQAMPDTKARLFEQYNHKRKFWVFRGYPVARMQARLQALAAQILGLDIIRNLLDKF
ncbi:RIO1 family regulatory kinase/ATPase domain-containing protein [Salinimonas lutimaris]|uniref:RIO1 family regulatory kinase/ATPase domain-containing protein n=1 Tax=Salinimonas lutimaris TaxID=914153 RepID=UPI001586476D|nr:RIO1 family regulatory kinase/ATPase [Salinimonas lutimaris]